MSEAREIKVLPAYHKCPKHGIGSVRLWFVLRDGDDGITWEFFTNLGPSDEAWAATPCEHPRHQRGWPSNHTTAGAVSWHFAAMPVDADADYLFVTDGCEVTGGTCYGDSGYLIGNELEKLLRDEGSDAVWARMAELLTEYRNDLPAFAPPAAPETEGGQPG